MSGFSGMHWLIYGVFIFGFAFPIYRSLKKAGLSGAWAIFCIVPILSIVPLWVLALSQWQVEDETSVAELFK